MKKLILLVAASACFAAFGQQNKIWAFSCSDKSIASNHTGQEGISYLQTGSLSASVLADRYVGKDGKQMPIALAQKAAKSGVMNARKAFVARLNQINLAYGGYLSQGAITWESAGQIFPYLFEAELPNMLLQQNGNAIAEDFSSVGVESVNRYPHMLKNGTEKALWIKTPNGAEPIISLFCFNIIGTMLGGVGNNTPSNPGGARNQPGQYPGKDEPGQRGSEPCPGPDDYKKCRPCQPQGCGDCGDDVTVNFSPNIPHSYGVTVMPGMNLPSVNIQTGGPGMMPVILPPVGQGRFSGGGSAINTGFSSTGGATNIGFGGSTTQISSSSGASQNGGF